ncbi:hypothetical protein Bhyg_03072 [Pseudolycoriella hygida]|uniref:Uncharacterized protein n=1 Tax=Pseudolycoriella hygida TaxID=35572 RepID=A0A9Q0MWV6_9DIPT|nr:hypothetical protein Bhyg_12173 [Pseudolycoriella hygida]KAJ6647849.1 hypothetical protein Bhyg_03072 [Pseudolycoriella hygida]
MATTKQWKESPPGPEQTELERMFENGLIAASDTPNNIRKANPMFMAFSARVFGVHFRKTRAKFGAYASTSIDQFRDQPEDDDPEIIELGLAGPAIPHKQARTITSSSTAISSYHHKLDSGITLKNSPYITWVYRDHVQNCDFVCVATCTISGSRDNRFMISEDGMVLHIHFSWPVGLFTPKELFNDMLLYQNMSADNPMIHSFSSRLVDLELSSKSNPKGTLSITLPMKVQREEGTWTITPVKSNGANIALLTFRAYQKKIIIKNSDTSINFD